MGDNIALELVARHAADDARHTALKLFHLKSVRQNRRQLGWSQPLVTEGKIDRLAQRSDDILEIHLTVGVGHVDKNREWSSDFYFPRTPGNWISRQRRVMTISAVPSRKNAEERVTQ